MVTRLRSSGNDLANDFVACNDGPYGWVDHAATDDVDGRAAASAVGDLDLDVLGSQRTRMVGPGLEGLGVGVGPTGESSGLVFAESVLGSRHC